eukprot:m.64223 g.64223  ORF g.64223 m.64223 type:complete len:142 (-) comp11992_c1_seq1:2335-2760(-)
MFIRTENRKKILLTLFKEGTLVAEKNFNAPKHPTISGVTNLEVIKSCQSLKSRGLVTECFAWRHFYWTLNDEGVEELRKYLHLDAEVAPNTHKGPARQPLGGDRKYQPRRQPRGEGYRREGAPAKTGSDFNPAFRGEATKA